MARQRQPTRLFRLFTVTCVFITRRDSFRARQTQSLLQATRDIRVLGVKHSLYRTRAALPALDTDVLLIDLRLEDGPGARKRICWEAFPPQCMKCA